MWKPTAPTTRVKKPALWTQPSGVTASPSTAQVKDGDVVSKVKQLSHHVAALPLRLDRLETRLQSIESDGSEVKTLLHRLLSKFAANETPAARLAAQPMGAGPGALPAVFAPSVCGSSSGPVGAPQSLWGSQSAPPVDSVQSVSGSVSGAGSSSGWDSAFSFDSRLGWFWFWFCLSAFHSLLAVLAPLSPEIAS
ncbi:hypothetical protein HDK77DRAFT_447747 [Phyllosticta capitalensis]